MATTMRPEQLADDPVLDRNGDKIGKVGTVYIGETTARPEWVTVKTGMLGQKETFVPLEGAWEGADGLHVQVSKDQVSDAPSADGDDYLSGEQSARLYHHYNLPMPRESDRREAAGDADDRSMVRSEERLRVGTEPVEAGRVRLRKHVVTEEQQVNVPVSHEEVRIEREPVDETERREPAEMGESEQEVTLYAEEPRVEKERVPVEKARLGKETVTEDRPVSDQVRREEFEVDDDSGRRDR
ncbi:uncharacterized protein (TIGR02271 family) [Prauserella shujinwangii]|uniref:Uncharacterized protein (TIGR02271 family) n=1 Tax=Prauserella shujinwangii TaxID=1453103 RepID=A0A2T0M007_9PSEU|nr:PRC and DUF2382 domain-containing protein [Prauserella shujinwangii]PRX49936.1 uncharacterized protein (TIGR02271 family) [Prauserella shujinwangii]